MQKGLLSLLLSSCVLAQTPQFTDPARKQKLMSVLPEADTIFEKFFRDRQTPGLVYGVVIDGEVVHIKSFGVQNLESKREVTADSMFRIASMTKSFTALAILKLRDAGKLSLDDAASKFVPELASLKYPTRDTAPLTIRQLLTHGAGFPEDNPWGDRQLAIPDAEMGKWIAKGLPFSTPPNTAYEYSNYGFALLGRIVAKASGVPYDKYIEREILLPLGLKAATLEPAKAPANLVAAGYGIRDQKHFEIPSLAHGSFGAMGGMVISAKDLGRYVAFHLSAEPARDEAEGGPVKRSSLREMQRPWRASGFSGIRTDGASEMRANSSGYGYGLSVTQDCHYSRIVAHGGGLPGFGSYMMWLPEYGVGLFAMSNLTYSGPAAPMRDVLLRMEKTGGLMPRSLAPSPVLKSTAAELAQIWNRWDDAAMDRLAADNLYLDTSRERYRDLLADLGKKFTECKPEGELRPENWLRGAFTLTCKEGKLNFSFTLAPTNPPKVQAFGIRAIANPSAEIRTLAEAKIVATPYGACTLGDVIGSNGKDTATYVIRCANGDAMMALRTLSGDGTATYSRAPGNACTP